MASWAFFGVSWDPFGGHLESLGASWGRPGELLAPSSGILDGILSDKAPKMPSRQPKEAPKASRRPPNPSRKHPQTPPRRLLETPNGFQERIQRITEKKQTTFERVGCYHLNLLFRILLLTILVFSVSICLRYFKIRNSLPRNQARRNARSV